MKREQKFDDDERVLDYRNVMASLEYRGYIVEEPRYLTLERYVERGGEEIQEDYRMISHYLLCGKKYTKQRFDVGEFKMRKLLRKFSMGFEKAARESEENYWRGVKENAGSEDKGV